MISIKNNQLRFTRIELTSARVRAVLFGCAGFALLSACGATTATLTPTTNAAQGGALSGTVVRDAIVPFATQLPMAGSANQDVDVAGELQDRVVRLTEGGTLVVAPRLRNLTASLFENTITIIEDITLTGFAGVDVEVFYRTDGVGEVAPMSFTRSADGDELTFTFDIDNDDTSLAAFPRFGSDGNFKETYFLSINTNATEFSTDGAFRIRGFVQSFNGRSDLDVTLTGTAKPVAP
jgi:hypothetical protein